MRSIREIALKIKAHGASLGTAILGEWGLFILVIVAIVAAFGLGRLSVLMAPHSPILVQNTASAALAGEGAGVGQQAELAEPVAGVFVGSKTGSVYYFPWCSGALQIAPESRRWFADEKAAQKAGYRATRNCKGMTTD